jgi:hypothetical protein
MGVNDLGLKFTDEPAKSSRCRYRGQRPPRLTDPKVGDVVTAKQLLEFAARGSNRDRAPRPALDRGKVDQHIDDPVARVSDVIGKVQDAHDAHE